MDYKEYWKSDCLRNITAGGESNPEGFDVLEFLSDIIEEIPEYDTLLDVGCGFGRLCRIVPPQKYIGIDINGMAISEARRMSPEYRFVEVEVDDSYPDNDVAMAYTVFLHMDDETLRSVIKNLTNSGSKYILISEILGREWRREGNPPVFNRDLNDYLSIMNDYGYQLISERHKPYKRYAGLKDRNTCINALLFKKKLIAIKGD